MSIRRLTQSIRYLAGSPQRLRLLAVAAGLTLLSVAGAAAPALAEDAEDAEGASQSAGASLTVSLTIKGGTVTRLGMVGSPCMAQAQVTTASGSQFNQVVTFEVIAGDTSMGPWTRTTGIDGSTPPVALPRPTQPNLTNEIRATVYDATQTPLGMSETATCASDVHGATLTIPTPPAPICFPGPRTTIARLPCAGTPADIGLPADVAPFVGP
jgi:hypothetical protein